MEEYSFKIKIMEGLLESATEYSEYSKWDLKDTFHTVPMKGKSKRYTTCKGLGRTFQWNVMHFGLIQAPGIWSASVAWVFDRVQLEKMRKWELRTIQNPRE